VRLSSPSIGHLWEHASPTAVSQTPMQCPRMAPCENGFVPCFKVNFRDRIFWNQFSQDLTTVSDTWPNNIQHRKSNYCPKKYTDWIDSYQTSCNEVHYQCKRHKLTSIDVSHSTKFVDEVDR